MSNQMIDLKSYIQAINETDKMVYMPYLTIGDPDFDTTVKLGIAMIDAGAHILELGIPFSDPTADGPVIQAAMVRSLSHDDFSLSKIFETAKKIHKARPNTPLVFLSYINPVLQGFQQNEKSIADANPIVISIKRFLKECNNSGICGVVIPDLPFDCIESEIFRKEARTLGISQIMLVAPNTGPDRMQQICEVADGFIYYVTSLGVTGVRSELPADLTDRVKMVQELSGVPVLAGFGISQPEHIKALKGVLDGVIVGSLNHKIIEEQGSDAQKKLEEMTKTFVDVC